MYRLCVQCTPHKTCRCICEFPPDASDNFVVQVLSVLKSIGHALLSIPCVHVHAQVQIGISLPSFQFISRWGKETKLKEQLILMENAR